MATYKLGRVTSRYDARNLKLAAYVDFNVLPASPMARDWTHPPGILPGWGMYRNNEIGCCTCASIAHLFTAQAANGGRSLIVGDDDVLGLYERVGNYDPTRPETDRGAQMIDVLRALRTGGMARQRISAFAMFDPRDTLHVEAAVNLFGGAYVGVDLPLAAQRQTVWDICQPGEYPDPFVPGSWGGHAMALLGYNRSLVTFVSWGTIRIATVAWFRMYCSEAWALIDPLWVDEGLAPSGFDLAQLRADLVDIHRGAMDDA